MQSLCSFIIEKFKIGSKNIAHSVSSVYNKQSPDTWDIHHAESGDIIYLDNLSMWFIYKGVDHKKEFHGYDDSIIYYLACPEQNNTKVFIGPAIGIGGINRPYQMHLCSDEECDKFIQILKSKGYGWDPDKKEIIKFN